MQGLLRVTSVNRLFSLIVATLFVVVAALAGWLLTFDLRAYFAADDALNAMQRFRTSLLVAEKISAERGPMNGMLGAELPASQIPDMTLLNAARARSDAQLQALQVLLLKQHCKVCGQQIRQIQQVRVDLAVRRAQADGLIHLPRGQRTPQALAECVDAMVAVIPELLPMISDYAAEVIESEPGTLDEVVLARLSAELREYAGLLGSRFTVALATHRQITVDELLRIERTRGRIDQLDALIEGREIQRPMIAEAAFEQMNRQYFGAGIDYVLATRVAASAPGGAPLTAAEFARVYVPLMQSITEFRDTVLDQAESVVRTHRKAALFDLLGTSVAASMLAMALFAMLTLFRRRVVQPLVGATRVISAISHGDLNTGVPHVSYRDEIAEMFDAIRVLKANAIEKVHIERQRDNLMVELEVMAQTDFLTGLANRRAFEKRAELICSESNDEQAIIALFMFDIDHFKRVNDTYGHGAGDQALVIVAELCRASLHQSDLIARLGGEEFAVLMRVTSREQAIEMAQRLRQRLSETDLRLGRGDIVNVTASFGIAFALQQHAPTLDVLMKCADEMLYRAKAAGRNCVIVDGPGLSV